MTLAKYLSGSSPRTLAVVVFAAIFLGSAGAISVFYVQAVGHLTDALRRHVGDLAETAASTIDMAAHEQLVSAGQFNGPLYRRVLAPLVQFHLRHPGIVYAYTIRVQPDGSEVVILDSTTDPAVRAEEAPYGREIIPSVLLEPYNDPDRTGLADVALRRGKSYVFVVPYVDDFGAFINGRTPLFDASGNYVGYAGVHYDIAAFQEDVNEVRLAGAITLGLAALLSLVLARTAKHVSAQARASLAQVQRAEIFMRHQRDRAETANTAKTELLRIATHDLKNPLSAIAGMSALLLKRTAPGAKRPATLEDAVDVLNTVHTSSKHMSDIVQGILVNEGLEAGGTPMAPAAVDVSALVREVLGFNEPAAKKKSINIQTDLPATLPAQADPRLVREAMDNYISNATKYSPAGATVTVALRPLADPPGWEFSVQDQGPGLSAEDQAKLFGKFQKLTPRPTGGESSTGLGLSIVKTIAELHHGSVGCETAEGRGCRFWLRVPLEPMKNSGACPPSAS